MMVAEAAVSFAVEKLGNLLIEKAVFLLEVKGEVEWMRDELKSMQGFLKDAAKKQSGREDMRNWISDLRNVAHDAEDAIEMFVLKVQSKKLKKRFGCFPNHLYHLNKVGDQIKSIRKELKEIGDRRVRYKIQEDEREEGSTRTTAQEGIENRRMVAYWTPDQHVVGLEEDVKLILGKAVFEKSQGRSVAAILGMGGMGKSTLASKIFNHPEVVGGFEFRAWVVVSREFNPEDIMKQILLKLAVSSDDLYLLGSIVNKLGRQELKKEVHERLSGKRYFIVLDDVWELSHWELLSTAFPTDGGSRLLLTSRNQFITMESGYVHRMKLLSDTESWDLFMRKALGVIGNSSSDECPKELKKVGDEIMKKCGGLPLAISVVGGLLAKKVPQSKSPSKGEWERVHKEWERVHTQMESHLDIYTSSGNEDPKTIGAILELSYHNLPPELKACFLCLGFFKEDAVIRVNELVHIWVAQGLVAQEVEAYKVRMEDVARDYLNELIGRNMVQVKEMEYGVKACQMHDLVRDLSIRKAKEEIHFEVLREGQDSSHQSLPKPRHRAIYYNELRFVYSTSRNQHLRSLFLNHYDEPWHIISDSPSSYWKSFELLRVLDFGEFIMFEVLPKGIGELTGLRYLKISSTDTVVRLPGSWAKLKNLEVLDLRKQDMRVQVIIIDKVITKMESIRHLYAREICCEVGLGNKKNLQTLQYFQVVSCHDVWKIQGLSGVSKLGIDIKEKETSSLFACLSSLENLFHLTLILPRPPIDLEGLTSLHRVTRLKLRNHDFPFGIYRVSAYFPPNLSHLTLTYIRFDEDPMPILEKLPNLIYLKLTGIYPKIDIRVSGGGFPTLQVLHINSMRKPSKVEIYEESAMPELNRFIITDCPYLDVENVPERIKSAIVQPH